MSEFNLENLTVFTTDLDDLKAECDADAMEVDDDASEPKKINIDADLKRLALWIGRNLRNISYFASKNALRSLW